MTRGADWTSRRVLEQLGAAFVAQPSLTVFSKSPAPLDQIVGPIDGPTLIAAVAAVLGYRSPCSSRGRKPAISTSED